MFAILLNANFTIGTTLGNKRQTCMHIQTLTFSIEFNKMLQEKRENKHKNEMRIEITWLIYSLEVINALNNISSWKL